MSNPLDDLAIDLAPASETIQIRGKSLKITGLSSGQLADIASEFSGFGEFLNQGRAIGEQIPNLPTNEEEITPEMARKIGEQIDINKMFALGGQAFPAIIAAAVGLHKDADTIKMAAGFAMEPQRDIVMHIMSLTFPRDTRAPLPNADANSAAQ